MTLTKYTVEIMHARNAGTHWVQPIGWTPQRPDAAQEDWYYDNGSYWSDHGEELALATADTQELCGDFDELTLDQLFWSTTGDCRWAGDVQAE